MDPWLRPELGAQHARGLFAKAITQSAYMISTPELKERKFGALSAEEAGVQLANTLRAPNIAALRAMDVDALVRAASGAGYAPWGAIDGHVLPRQLVDVFDRGEQAPVPLLAGFNSGEIRSLRFLAPPPPASAVAGTSSPAGTVFAAFSMRAVTGSKRSVTVALRRMCRVPSTIAFTFSITPLDSLIAAI